MSVLRIVQVPAVGGTLDRVLDERDLKVAEFYRPGDAERFLALPDLRAACEALVAGLDRELDGGGLLPVSWEALDAARAAIAKVKP